MTEILFNFPEIKVIKANGPPSNPGVLVLSVENVPEDTKEYLNLRFFSTSDFYADIDIRLCKGDVVTKLDPSTFKIEPTTNSGKGTATRNSEEALTIIFPPTDVLVPQNDPRISQELKTTNSTWGVVVGFFEIELGRIDNSLRNSSGNSSGKGPENNPEKSSQYPNGKAVLSRDIDAPAYASSSKAMAAYHPSDHQDNKEGRLVLVDEENGHEVGEVNSYHVHAIGVTPGSKDPVEIQLPENQQGTVTVRPAQPEYLRDSLHPAYAKSTLVSTAATASRLIVTTSSYVANAIQSGADAYVRRTKPNEVPMVFDPSTHDRVRQIHNVSSSAAKISAQTIGQVTKHAQNLGARIAGKNQDRPSRGQIPNPGLLNKGLIAFSTIADGIDHASKNLLNSGANAATTVVGHKYGEEARSVAHGLTGSVTNVGLVYVDASGVSRRAVIKGVAKGMVIGKVRGGGDVIVPGPQDSIPGQQLQISQGFSTTSLPVSGATTPGGYGSEVGFGNAAPPSYGNIQGTQGLNGSPSGSGYNQNSYFPPPPLQRSVTAPQTTGNYPPEKVSANGQYRYL
ncbi:uncharacterized protein LAJ45_03492 [Morchella importuna]|uniref:Senescence domain-containing protein n=1 Tax=Morchella conica CCBAS932 TaxID=1392247 RepID=A0A3N4KKF5_9PEZI|nr:uncharacterized protein LAJ45_03492 [Morchella importuna]KAH8152651.1 hypothetical protein LAJ45_03492 [Morchella importuna]RPB11037.1 hypothetical protein P167DRAFT_537062 [Morchella conica CCBAS932]